MISRYSEILHYTKIINKELRESPGHIQKIYSTAYYLSLQVRIRGKSIYLLIGRGGGHEGIFLTTALPKSFLRKIDKWLEWMRKNISGSLLLEIETDKEDRAIAFKLQKSGKIEKLYIAWIGRESGFFFVRNDSLCFKSWGVIIGDESVGYDLFNQIGRRKIDTNGEVRKISGDELLKEEEAAAIVNKDEAKLLKKKESKLKKIERDLLKIKEWENIKKWLDDNSTEKLNGLREIKFGELKIKFKPDLSDYQKRDELYKKIKSLKVAENIQLKRLSDERNQEKSSEIKNNLKTISPLWNQAKVLANSKVNQSEDYQVIKFDGFSIGIGDNADGNDQMRKKWATGEDVWVHASIGKSSHAIIKLNSGVIFTIEMLKVAATFIQKKSGKEKGPFEVVYTQVKNLKSVSKTTGMVIFKKEKRIIVDTSEIQNV